MNEIIVTLTFKGKETKLKICQSRKRSTYLFPIHIRRWEVFLFFLYIKQNKKKTTVFMRKQTVSEVELSLCTCLKMSKNNRPRKI